jgi:NAD(P)-dependent dehydrogenase (short-subunit alcohol dehydrogenase family)
MKHTPTALRWFCKENLMIRVQYVINLLVAAMLVIGFSTDAISKQETKMKSVLVTGASTGIGRNLAETLASNGYHVYAGARKDKDLAALNAIENITSVKLDVTKQDEIDAVVALIREKGTGLYALVNNAVLGNRGMISEAPIEDHNFVYRVNVEGVYRVTKAFSSLIVESKGRISTTGSIAGTLTRAGGSAYSGSKHWIEAFTDALALEMAPLGVMVSVIQPGNYQSHIRRSGVLRVFAKVKAAGGEITPDMQKMLVDTTARELSFKKPDEVSAAFMHALFDEKPLRRYVVTPNQQEQALTISTKIRQLVELNQWGPHSYTRDQLIEMLDKTIAEKAK